MVVLPAMTEPQPQLRIGQRITSVNYARRVPIALDAQAIFFRRRHQK
jgi:hypothetical protein